MNPVSHTVYKPYLATLEEPTRPSFFSRLFCCCCGRKKVAPLSSRLTVSLLAQATHTTAPVPAASDAEKTASLAPTALAAPHAAPVAGALTVREVYKAEPRTSGSLPAFDFKEESVESLGFAATPSPDRFDPRSSPSGFTSDPASLQPSPVRAETPRLSPRDHAEAFFVNKLKIDLPRVSIADKILIIQEILKENYYDDISALKDILMKKENEDLLSALDDKTKTRILKLPQELTGLALLQILNRKRFE